MKVKCPCCSRESEWKPENQYRPFCSERCKLIDFGAWAKGDNFIPGDPDIDIYASEENTDFFKPTDHDL